MQRLRSDDMSTVSDLVLIGAVAVGGYLVLTKTNILGDKTTPTPTTVKVSSDDDLKPAKSNDGGKETKTPTKNLDNEKATTPTTYFISSTPLADAAETAVSQSVGSNVGSLIGGALKFANVVNPINKIGETIASLFERNKLGAEIEKRSGGVVTLD